MSFNSLLNYYQWPVSSRKGFAIEKLAWDGEKVLESWKKQKQI